MSKKSASLCIIFSGMFLLALLGNLALDNNCKTDGYMTTHGRVCFN